MPHASRAVALIALVIFVQTAVRGQENGILPLSVQEIIPGGVRTSVTESWGTFSFIVTNPNATPRDARVIAYYPERPDLQYARDVWVPAQSTLTAWLPVGPAPKQSSTTGRTIEMLIFDRTGGQDRLLLPKTDERIRSRAVSYRQREPSTTIMLDDPTDENEPDYLFRPKSGAYQALDFARTMRLANGYSEAVSMVSGRFLPPMSSAFDGIDHFVLASNRIAADPPGLQALRQWVQQGGKLWVMLDLVDAKTIARILGDDCDLPIADRISMETIGLHRERGDPLPVQPRQLDEPVAFVRVLPTAKDRILHRVNGWPASFVRQVGRGKVVFTALGARGWHTPRGERDPKSPYVNFPNTPIPTLPLVEFAAELRPRSTPQAYTSESLRPLLNEEIGYSVIDRRLAGGILGTFVLVLIGLGIGLRRSRRPELVGWLGPFAAVLAAGAFVALGAASRQAVPTTVAVVELIDPVAGSGEAAVDGLFAVYHPTSGLTTLGTRAGGMLDLDMEGLEGQTRRRVQTDSDAWHWENLAMPAGVRSGPFRYTIRTGPITALVHFGPDGIEGRLTAGGFQHPSDVVITAAAKEPVAVRIAADGAFTVGRADALTAGQYLSGAVLSDRQQRRQAVYRNLLADPLPEHMEGRELLLAWADAPDVPFSDAADARTAGTSLLVVPLEWERPAAATTVTIPSAFIPYRRVSEGGLGRPTLEATTAVDMELRFQLPLSVLPLAVERATFVARVQTPGWRFTAAGLADGKPVPLFAADSPAEPIRIEITDPKFLQPDAKGGIHLNIKVDDIRATGSSTKWTIESLTLEVIGRTATR